MLKSFNSNLSGKVSLLIFVLFVITFLPKMSRVVSDEETCLCAYDGYGYYMYLPHLFEKGHLDIKQEWAQQLQNNYCDGIYAYQIVRTETGKELNIYHMGQAYIELPAYLIGDVFARMFGYETDGFSKPYFILFILNALFFIFLGLLYLRKTLLLFFNDKTAAIAILVLYVASNIYITFFLQYDLQHLYLFALNAIFFYHTIQFSRTLSRKHLLLSAIILGLTVAIRPTQVLLGVFPLVLLLSKYGIRGEFLKRIWIYPVFGLLWNIPQIAYWWIIGGEPFIPNLHSENLILSDPNIFDFLFSYKKGWLLYTPLFLLILHGMYIVYHKNRVLFWSFAVFTPLYIWVMSSWECWWYASSYSSRVMVDIYPLLIVLVGFSIVSWKKNLHKILGYSFLVGVCMLNILQTYQGMKGYLSFDSMTKQHYWYIFGRTDIPNYTGIHLELNRGIVDPEWIERAKNLPSDDYTYKQKIIHESTEPLTIKEAVTIKQLVVLDEVPSDEGMLEINIDYKTTDSTKSVILMFETLSEYKWNWYNWSPIELSKGQVQDSLLHNTYYVNIQRLRHDNDNMNIYFNSLEGGSIEVKGLKITAHTIERD